MTGSSGEAGGAGFFLAATGAALQPRQPASLPLGGQGLGLDHGVDQAAALAVELPQLGRRLQLQPRGLAPDVGAVGRVVDGVGLVVDLVGGLDGLLNQLVGLDEGGVRGATGFEDGPGFLQLLADGGMR